MKFMIATVALSLAFTTNAFAKTESNAKMKEAAAKFVPSSKVVKEDGNEFDLLTAKDSIVEIELNRDMTLDEASGDAADAGDALTPGNGLIELSSAVASLKKAGKNPSGDWSLEKSLINGWVYEFEGMENGKRMEYTVNAKDGKIISGSRDIL